MKEPIKTDEELLSFLNIFVYRFKELQKISRQIHRIDENGCNGYTDDKGKWDEKAQQKAERREEKLILKAEKIAEFIGLKVYHQGDCRGVSLYLITELMGSNDYNNGIAVY